MTELLIIKPSSLGDIVHGLQVVESWKVQRPELRIHWIVRDLFAPLVAGCETVDRVYEFARRGGWRGFGRMMDEVRATRFDAVLDLQGLLRSGLMTWRARGGVKLGRSDAREGAGWFYDRRVPLPAGAGPHHAVEILLQFAPPLGLAPEVRGRLRFRVAGDGTGPVGGAGYVLMFPDSRRPEKNWGGFRELTRLALAATPARRVVWAGNEAARDDGAYAPDRFMNLTARTSLAALPGLIAGAAVVVSNDSGPMHLAAAQGVPVVAVFGPTDPRCYGPYPLSRPTHRVVVAPAGELRRLEAAVVLEAVEAVLAAGAAGG